MNVARKQPERTVDLWLVALSDTDSVSAEDLHHDEDIRRYDQIALPNRKRRFGFRRRTLRHVLGQYASNYELTTGACGKPHIVSESGRHKLHFSASASRDVCAIAVSAVPVGVDIEMMPSRVDMVGIVERFITTAHLQSNCHASGGIGVTRWPAPMSLRTLQATMTWCRFEAHTKLYGHSLHQGLFAERESMYVAPCAPNCHIVALAGLSYVCMVALEQPFIIGNLRQIDYASLVHGRT